MSKKRNFKRRERIFGDVVVELVEALDLHKFHACVVTFDVRASAIFDFVHERRTMFERKTF